MRFRSARPEDAAAAVAFVAQFQDDTESMIPYLTTGQDRISGELAKLEPSWIDSAHLALEDDQLVGVALAEYDQQQGRAWIYGPWVVDRYWDRAADALVQRVLDDLAPAGINDVELSGHVDHVRLAALAEHRGLDRSKVFFVLGVDRARTEGWDRPGLVRVVTEAQAEAVAQLHDQLFPGTVWTGRQLLDRASRDVTVLVAAEEGRVVGYVAAEMQPGPEGYIHYVGVDTACRRQGLGRTLVVSAVRELLRDPEVANVYLSVDSTSAPAVDLYRSLGFATTLAMVGFRTPAARRARTAV